jgi:pimeloyl-ACP methyl ester carboxylesterase
LNLGREYASWFPPALLKAGLKQLPGLLGVQPGELDTSTVLARAPVNALIVAGMEDKIMPPSEVRKVFRLAAPGSELVEVPGATHESVPYYFDIFGPPLKGWLNLQTSRPDVPSGD